MRRKDEKNKIDLTELNEVKMITTGYARPGAQNAENEVNRLLREGWILLETYATYYGNAPPLSYQEEVHFSIW